MTTPITAAPKARMMTHKTISDRLETAKTILLLVVVVRAGEAVRSVSSARNVSQPSKQLEYNAHGGSRRCRSCNQRGGRCGGRLFAGKSTGDGGVSRGAHLGAAD